MARIMILLFVLCIAATLLLATLPSCHGARPIAVTPFVSARMRIVEPVLLAGNANDTAPLPVVLWHGMGDTCCSESMNTIKRLIEQKLGVFVYSVQTADNANAESWSGFKGNVNDQVAKVRGVVGMCGTLEVQRCWYLVSINDCTAKQHAYRARGRPSCFRVHICVNWSK